jgi:hypothetical protein
VSGYSGSTSATGAASNPIGQILGTAVAFAMSVEGAVIDFANIGGIDNKCITEFSTFLGIVSAVVAGLQLWYPGPNPVSANMKTVNEISLGLGLTTTVSGQLFFGSQGAC